MTFQLCEPGHCRILAGDVFSEKINAANVAGNAEAAERLPIILIPGKWEENARLPLHELVMDRLFGVGTHAPSVILWGHGDVIDLWSDERWAEAVETTIKLADA
ncbi:MAG: hypothetical protein R3C30_01595 [Hyphomonadaceae bacterium]